jgi:hypothetical protein
LVARYGAGAVILPSLAILSLGLGVYLVMLGMLAEYALHQRRGLHAGVVPVAVETGRPGRERNSE